MMNEQTFKGHWTELRGRVKEQWGDLTDDDLVLAEGNADKLIGIIERRTGQGRDQIEQELSRLAGETGNWREQWSHRATAAAAAAGDAVRQYAEQTRSAARDYVGSAGGAARGYADSARQFAEQYYGQAGDLTQQQYDAITHSFRAGYDEAQQAIRKNPLESIAVAFGTGLIAGVITGLALRPRR